MGTETGISWCDATWNPWYGCTPVSEGCEHCYARRDMARRGLDADTVTRSKTQFNAPLKKKRDGSWAIPDGSFVFVCSWSDFFHEDVPLRWHHEAVTIMERRPHLTFLVLTKRVEMAARIHPVAASNIWLGVTAENQERADERIPQLLSIDWPGKKWVSVEPMLGRVILSEEWILPRVTPEPYALNGCVLSPARGPNWVIAGGESGPGARPMELEWARSLRNQCRTVGIPFWMKQLGGWPNRREALEDLPEDLRIRERPEQG